jgi:hypothetical protein
MRALLCLVQILCLPALMLVGLGWIVMTAALVCLRRLYTVEVKPMKLPFAIPGWVTLKLVTSLVACGAILAGVYQVKTWHDSHVELQAVRTALKAERHCAEGSLCHTRTQAAIASERQKSDAAWRAIVESATAALEGMARSREEAQRAARDWRERYEAAIKEPKCAAWAQGEVQCPVE